MSCARMSMAGGCASERVRSVQDKEGQVRSIDQAVNNISEQFR